MATRAFDEYRASVEQAREWFSEQHSRVEDSFEVLTQGFSELARCIQVGRDANNKTHVSLAPLLWICQRQSFVALDTLASRQAYQSWLLLRPGIEAVLIIGKWVDNIENYDVWQNRFSNPKRYRKKYTGKALVTRSLPRSDEIQVSLRTINDLFVHPNADYYMRHTELVERDDRSVQVSLRFFDEDEFHWASVLGMVHLLIVSQESLANLFATTFVNLEVRPESFGLSQFEALHHEAALDVAKSDLTSADLIHDIGLWPRANGG